MTAVSTLPQLTVELDGRRPSAHLSAGLSRIRVRRALARPAQCELTFVGFDPTERLPQTAQSLTVRVDDQSVPLFDGEVTAVELRHAGDGERELRVRGYDLLHRLRKRQPVRALVDLDMGDLAREVVADLGWAVSALDPGPKRARIFQHRRDDFQLLTEEAGAYGLFPVYRDGELHLLTLDGVGEPLSLTVGAGLLEARFELNGAPSCRAVETLGWDPARIEPHHGMALGSRIGLDVPGEAPPEPFQSNGERCLWGRPVDDVDQSLALAQGELDRRLAAEVTLWGIADGDPELRPGSRVDIDGTAADFCGRYVLTAVEHRVDEQAGFVTELTSEPPEPASAARPAQTAAWGTVTRVDDPDGLGRVKVELTAQGGLETGWLEVVCPGAGEGKGLVALPDVDDRVLVLWLDPASAHGLVLGGHFGPDQPYDTGVEGNGIQRFHLRTPGGQRLRLDDERNIARLENGKGSYVQLSPGKVRLHANTDLVIEAPGRVVKIRGKKIDFERA